MATKRCIPVRFFKDPDVVKLRKETQLILIGLVLCADDEGRGVADASILGREIDFSHEDIEAALQELVEHHLLTLYQVERHRYYSLTQQWQNMGSKKTASKLPAPPRVQQEEVSIISGGNDGTLRENAGKSELSQKNPAQSNLIESNSIEDGGQTTTNVITFPTQNSDDSVEREVIPLAQNVARVLKLQVTDALTRIVQEYRKDPTLSLLGEADAAREWIDDTRRNKKGQRMSPAFFRRWLKREQQTQHHQATGTTGVQESPQRRHPPGAGGKSLMHLETEYQSLEKKT